MRAVRIASMLMILLFMGTAGAQTPNYLSWSRFQAGQHPDYVSPDSLDIHVAWCVWHEGVPLYQDGLPIDAFRQACMAKQEHNGVARGMVELASNNELNAALDRMHTYFSNPENGGYQMLNFHLSWVLHHKKRRAEVLNFLDKGDIRSIRAIYMGEQGHHPHVHFLIQAADDATVTRLLNDMK